MGLVQVDIYLYACIILLYILYCIKKENRDSFKSNGIFNFVLIATCGLLFFEGWAWVVNKVDSQLCFAMNFVSNHLLFTFNFLPSTAWFMYLDDKVIGERKVMVKRRRFYLMLNIALMLGVLMNIKTGIVFTIETGNVYSRGIGVYIIAGTNIVLITGYILSLLKYRKYIMGNVLHIILCLSVLPIVGGLIQTLFYGMTLIWPMLSLVALFAYLLIEREEMLKDKLTGLLTRSHLEKRLRFKLRHGQPFSIIMIDMDDFKTINDRFGHDEGDIALKTFASVLNVSIKRMDSVYRYGGDEFIVIIESILPEVGKGVMERITEKIDEINSKELKEYKLKMSMGHLFVDKDSKKNVFELLADADAAMYIEKSR